MSTEPQVDPTIKPVEYIPRSSVSGPRESAHPMYDDDDSVVVAGTQKQVAMTPELIKEVDRLQKDYNSTRTVAHHAEIRRRGNLSVMKLLGLTIITYIYMGLAVLLSRNEEVNL